MRAVRAKRSNHLADVIWPEIKKIWYQKLSRIHEGKHIILNPHKNFRRWYRKQTMDRASLIKHLIKEVVRGTV